MGRVSGTQRILGTLCGITLIIAWFLILMKLEQAVNQGIYENPLLDWLLMGPIPFFISVPLTWFSWAGYSEKKKKDELAGASGMAAGFFLWVVTILLVPPPACTVSCYNSIFYVDMGGYLLMLVLIMAFQGKIRLRDAEPA